MANRPKVGVVLGSGLGAFADTLADRLETPYAEIQGWPQSTAAGHAGKLAAGRIGETEVIVLSGRSHLYEGYSAAQVTFGIRELARRGVNSLVLTNAAGGIDLKFNPGDLVLISDHINLLGVNPLTGPNDETLGPRFPDMSEPYTRALIALAETVALDLRQPIQRGVFVAVPGPNLETAAEYRFLRGIGADVVGMSLVPETIVAVHGGMRVLAFNVVTDACLPDALKPVDLPEVLAVAGRTAPALTRLVTEIVRRLDEVS